MTVLALSNHGLSSFVVISGPRAIRACSYRFSFLYITPNICQVVWGLDSSTRCMYYYTLFLDSCLCPLYIIFLLFQSGVLPSRHSTSRFCFYSIPLERAQFIIISLQYIFWRFACRRMLYTGC